MPRVLVIDDDESVRAMAVEMLRRQPCEAVAADGGQSAVQLAETETFDLFILDLSMPGMSGEETFVALRKLAPDVPVLFITGYAEDDFSGVLLTSPRTSLLTKPFAMADLHREVSGLLDSAA